MSILFLFFSVVKANIGKKGKPWQSQQSPEFAFGLTDIFTY